MGARQVVGNDTNDCTGGDSVTECRHISGTHPDTAKARGAPKESFLGRTMDVDATIKRVSVAGLFPLEPEDAGDNRITTGSIWLQDFAGRHP